MSEKDEALLRRQHADNIGIMHMKIRIERLEAENKRLRGLLTEAKDLAWSFGADSLLDRINAALRREET